MPRRIRKPTKARPARRRLRGAVCHRPRRLLGRDRLCSAGSVRSQADEARRHAGGRTSGNGPDTTERAPLDARGWVPFVFRARPANDKESGRAMPATPGKKDRLTCAWGLQPKGRKDATREGQDDGSRRRSDDWTTASDGICPARVAETSMPEEWIASMSTG